MRDIDGTLLNAKELILFNVIEKTHSRASYNNVMLMYM